MFKKFKNKLGIKKFDIKNLFANPKVLKTLIALVGLPVVISFIMSACKPVEPTDPCEQAHKDANSAWTDYNTNANACLNNYIPALMADPTYGSAYKNKFNSNLPGSTRIDSLFSADHTWTQIEAGGAELNPEFKQNGNNSQSTAQASMTSNDLYNYIVSQNQNCF